jgi:hypothetical protein
MVFEHQQLASALSNTRTNRLSVSTSQLYHRPWAVSCNQIACKQSTFANPEPRTAYEDCTSVGIQTAPGLPSAPLVCHVAQHYTLLTPKSE